MAIEVITGSCLEELARALAAGLDRSASGSVPGPVDPFDPALILVPNVQIRKWLQMEIARTNEVAINLEVEFFEAGLWHLLEGLETRSQGNSCSRAREAVRLTREPLQTMIIVLLLSPPPHGATILAPVLKYVQQDMKINPEDPEQARKLWQVSDQLARLFREYEYHRPEMIRGWLKQEDLEARPAEEPASDQAEGRSMEPCQAALYQALFSRKQGLRDRLADAVKKEYLSLPQYADRVLEKIGRESLVNGQRPLIPVHLFGVHQLSVFHRDLLSALAPFYDWRIYYPRIVPGNWPGEEPLEPPEGSLAGQWGNRGSQSNRLLHDLLIEGTARWNRSSAGLRDPGQKSNSAGPGPAARTHPPSLLGAVQDMARNSFRPQEEPAVRQDRSLQVVGCPGIHREVETVYNSIINNMMQDTSLKLTDIAIYVTDMARYKPVIDNIFGRQPQNLSYNLADSSASEDSVFAQAVMGLLSLVQGSFSRKEVFELVLNPCFLTAGRLNREDVMQWIRWAEGLNIFRGFGKEDKYAGSGIPVENQNPLYTWQQGMRRLRFGRIMETPEERVGDEAFSHYHGIVPFADMFSNTGSEPFSGFQIIEQLFTAVQDLRAGPRSGKRWNVLLRGMVTKFLGIPPDRPEEAAVRERLLETLSGKGPGPEGLQLFDAILGTAREQDMSLPLTGISLALLREFVTARLGAIETRKGAFLTGGVTITMLNPERAVPSRIVYILGLGEGEFPGKERPSALDLRALEKASPTHDVPSPDLKRYAFLETLLATRDKLYLTYVDRHLQKDQVYYPCSVVNQLVAAVDQNLFGRHLPPKTGKPGTGEPGRSEGTGKQVKPGTGELGESGGTGKTAESGESWGTGETEEAGDGGKKLAFEIFEMPLKGSSPRIVLGSQDPDTARKTDLFDRNYSRIDNLLCYEQLLSEGLLKGSVPGLALVKKILKEAVPEFPGHGPAEARDQQEDRIISIADLSRFLRNPVEASLRRHLGIYEDLDEDLSLAEDEPFATGFPFDYQLLKGTMEPVVTAGTGLNPTELEDLAQERLKRHYQKHHRLGATPDAAFERLDEGQYQELLHKMLHPGNSNVAGLPEFLSGLRPDRFRRNVVFGESASSEESDLQFPPLKLEIDTGDTENQSGHQTQVRLHGDIPYLWTSSNEDPPQILALAPTSKLPADGKPTRHLLGPFLFYMAALAAPWSREFFEGRGVRINVLFKTGVAWWQYPPLEKETAEEYLTGLLRDLLAPHSFDLLPLEIIRDITWELNGKTKAPHLDQDTGEVPAELSEKYIEKIEFKLSQEAEKLHSQYRPPRVMNLVNPRVPPDAYQKVRRRLSPLFAFRESSHGK